MKAMQCCLVGLTALWLAPAPAVAGPIVTFRIQELVTGDVRYNLTLDNTTGVEAISGLLVVNPGDVFGLDEFSVARAPQDVGGDPAADWGVTLPLPPGITLLFYLSFFPEGDVAAGASLAGFSFVSPTPLVALRPGDFAVEAILAGSATELPLGDAVFVPEPGLLLLFGTGLAALAVRRSRP